MTTETNLKALYIFRCLFTTSSVKLFIVNVQIFVYNCVFWKKEKQHSQNLSHVKIVVWIWKWKWKWSEIKTKLQTLLRIQPWAKMRHRAKVPSAFSKNCERTRENEVLKIKDSRLTIQLWKKPCQFGERILEIKYINVVFWVRNHLYKFMFFKSQR